MNRKVVSNLPFGFCAVSLPIAIYQLSGARVPEGALRVVYAVMFLLCGVANRRK